MAWTRPADTATASKATAATTATATYATTATACSSRTLKFYSLVVGGVRQKKSWEKQRRTGHINKSSTEGATYILEQRILRLRRAFEYSRQKELHLAEQIKAARERILKSRLNLAARIHKLRSEMTAAKSSLTKQHARWKLLGRNSSEFVISLTERLSSLSRDDALTVALVSAVRQQMLQVMNMNKHLDIKLLTMRASGQHWRNRRLNRLTKCLTICDCAEKGSIATEKLVTAFRPCLCLLDGGTEHKLSQITAQARKLKKKAVISNRKKKSIMLQMKLNRAHVCSAKSTSTWKCALNGLRKEVRALGGVIRRRSHLAEKLAHSITQCHQSEAVLKALVCVYLRSYLRLSR